jgi:hypothetical protein
MSFAAPRFALHPTLCSRALEAGSLCTPLLEPDQFVYCFFKCFLLRVFGPEATRKSQNRDFYLPMIRQRFCRRHPPLVLPSDIGHQEWPFCLFFQIRISRRRVTVQTIAYRCFPFAAIRSRRSKRQPVSSNAQRASHGSNQEAIRKQSESSWGASDPR